MEWDLFEDKIKKQEYKELECILSENKDDLIVKYQLGRVYSYQDEQKQKAIDIFKELIEMNFQKTYIYIFLAKHIFDYKERINIIKCGVSLFFIISTFFLYFFLLVGQEDRVSHKPGILVIP